MDNWAVVVTAVFLAMVLALSAPLVSICLGPGQDLATVYQAQGPILIAGLFLVQALLMLVPVDITQRRPKSRRRLLVPVITTAFLLAIAVVGIAFSLLAAAKGDAGFEAFGKSNLNFLAVVGIVFAVSWLVWACIFWRYAQKDRPKTLIKRLMNRLFGGSVLELLVAVPAHVIVRQRQDCCAPLVTFFGISSGLVLMLLAFGPGIIFLFAVRFARLRRKK